MSMRLLRVIVLAAAWLSLSFADDAEATTNDVFSGSAQEAQMYGLDQDGEMAIDYAQQPAPVPYQQAAYEPDQVPHQQPVARRAPRERFLPRGASKQPVPGWRGVPTSTPAQSAARPSATAADKRKGPSDLIVTIAPADTSEDAVEGAASYHQSHSGFSICDIIPPPWNILCMIIEFVFFTWPMYLFWLGLIALFIIYRIYLAFKEILDPIFIAILDAIYLVVWVIVRTCQAIWRCIKYTSYPIKESIIACTDRVDHTLNPWKKRNPHTHVPGFSY